MTPYVSSAIRRVRTIDECPSTSRPIPKSNTRSILSLPVGTVDDVEDPILTNREIASLVLLLFFVAWSIKSVGCSRLLGSVRDLGVTILTPSVLVPILLYLLWISVAVFFAGRLGLWDLGLLMPTIVWISLSGIALIFRLSDAINKPGFFKRAALRAAGITAIVEFVANLESFPLWVEIPTQTLAVFSAMITVVAERQPEHARVRRLATRYLTSFGLLAISWSLVHLVTEWPTLNRARIGREFLLPVWLTSAALPFVYGFAVVAGYQSSFRMMGTSRDNGSLLRQRLAVILRANLRLGAVRLANGIGALRIARTETFRQAWREVGTLQEEARQRVEEEAAAGRRLIENAGVVGTDPSGRQLDQREFAETRKALRWLATCQRGHYHNAGGRYRSDLLPIIESHFTHDGLPEKHGIQLHVSPDGQQWYAARQTITGWWFAIGAAGPPPDEWIYDGPHPPRGFPAEPDWDRHGLGPASANCE